MKRQLAAGQNVRDTAKANHDKAEADVKLGEEADALAMKMQQDAAKKARADLKWWDDLTGPQMLADADLRLKQRRHTWKTSGTSWISSRRCTRPRT